MINDKATEDQINQLKRWCMCQHDLQMALSSLTFLNEELDYDKETYHYVELRRLKCFELSFVISYSRAFTESKGSRYKKLELSKIGIKLSDKQKPIHDKILELRQKIYAHSDQEFYVLRADHYEMDANGLPFHLTNIQADEGLHFTDFFENMAAMDLMRQIKHVLYCKINEVANKQRANMPIVLSRQPALPT